MDDPLSPLIWLYLVLALALTFVTAFFSASETSFSSLNKYRFEVEADNGNRISKAVLRLYSRFDHTLITVIIGINAVSVISSVLMTNFFLSALPMLSDGLSSFLASIALTIFVYLFGETIPKQIAKKIPNTVAKMVVYPLTVVFYLIYPIALLFRFFSWIAGKTFKSKKNPEFTEEDFTSAIERNERGGALEEEESDILQNSLEFTSIAVKDVLTPKNKMYEINIKGMSTATLAETLCDTTYSRIPVYYEKKDKIVGIIIVKNFLADYVSNPKIRISDYIEKPYVVSPSIKLDDLVDGFRNNHTQIAIVKKKDELIGMVTMEDVLEELVGPIGEKSVVKPEEER
ncbi:MAG: HlyC/CorC family transporter [Bacilli bacterium]|nr:HlyC/CorC family transporter [Bacilli bacterium]